MAKVKSELKNIFEAEGYLNSGNLEEITLENEDEGIIDLAKILTKANGKNVKVSVIVTESVDIPIAE